MEPGTRLEAEACAAEILEANEAPGGLIVRDVVEKDVVVPETVDTLEWVLDSPPPLHQFEESPIIVEIAGIEPAASR